VAAAVACTADPVFVPEQTVTLPATTLNEGDAGSAQASSGDPFAFNLGANQLVLPPNRNGSPVGVTLTQANVPNPNPNPVPEPGALSLAVLALAAAAAATRSGKKSA
jgi:hypothetical protein